MLHRSDDGYEPLRLSTAGNFSVTLEDTEPTPQELIALDAAGRRAELNEPSASVDDAYAALFDGKKASEDPKTFKKLDKAPPPPAPKKAEKPEPAKAEKPKPKKVEKPKPKPKKIRRPELKKPKPPKLTPPPAPDRW